MKKAKSAGKTIVKQAIVSGAGGLKPALVAILETIGKLRAIGMEQPKRADVQSFSGNAKTPDGFKKNLGFLRKQLGLIEFPTPDTVALTDKGIQHVGEVDPSSLTNESIQEEMKKLLAPKACEIFDAIADGAVHDRKEVARQLGYDMTKLSGYDKNISRMKTLEIVAYPTKTTFQLTDRCFPLGRPMN